MEEWKPIFGLSGYYLQGAVQELSERGMRSQADKLMNDPQMRSLNVEAIKIVKNYMAGRLGNWK